MNLSCYIIDDELHAVELLRSFVRRTPGLELCGASTRPLQALTEIPRLSPQVCFVDIDMPELLGLDLAASIRRTTMVVFTTAYREFAADAFEQEAADYLLKPISYERFLKCVEKLSRNLPGSNAPAFFVKTGVKGLLQRVAAEDIVYISGLAAYVELHLATGRIVTYIAMNELLTQLPADRFSRIHKSYIVRHSAILKLSGGRVEIQGGISLPVGRAYRFDFYKKLGHDLLIPKRS